MEKTYLFKVTALMDALSLNQSEFAARVEATQGTVSRWRQGKRPDPEWADRIDRLFEETFGGESAATEFTTVVRVVGKIGAGAEIMPEIEQVSPEGLFEIEIQQVVEQEALAFVVEGDSMYPRYDDGDVVLCDSEIHSAMDVVGQEAAVRTADGKRFLKRVRRGSKAGLFDLESHNAPIIRDVKLEWAARIAFIIPAPNWRKLTKADQQRLVDKTRPKSSK